MSTTLVKFEIHFTFSSMRIFILVMKRIRPQTIINVDSPKTRVPRSSKSLFLFTELIVSRSISLNASSSDFFIVARLY